MLPLSYSLRNLGARPGRSVATAGVVALVVVASALLLGLISSLKRTLVSSGDPLNLIVLRKGSDNDGSSAVSLAAYHAVRYFDEIARDELGRPLVSPELVVQPFFFTNDGGRENVLVRGVEPWQALGVHAEASIAEGRMFIPSNGEAVVGRGVVGRYQGATLGSELEFGRRKWKVVGVLESGGSSFESEVWVDVRELANDAKRTMPYSGIRLRASGPESVEPLRRRINADPRHALEAQPEPAYYAKQGESANSLYVLVVGIAVLAGIGAGFGASNTMYAAVQSRIGEIGTLRALGFSRRAILAAFEIEAVALALAGFAAGAVLSAALAAAVQTLLGSIGFGASTFTTSIVTLRIAASDLLVALALTLLIGICGGLAPAWRAAHLRPIEALHKG